jgi:DNA-binding NarL/FixJ family response regulator
VDVMERRIVLVDMPTLMREIVRNILTDEPDLEVVAELDDGDRLLGLLESTGARNVVWGADGVVPNVEPVLAAFPSVRVLAILEDGRSSFLYRLRPHKSALGQMSPERLVGAIRENGR